MMRTEGTADAAVGMMDGAYFTSRTELLDFFNDLLDMNLAKIEQTATGAVACQLIEYIFPRSVPMSRVNWEAKADHEFVGNYKLLQAAFDKNRVQRHVDVDKLIRAKYQDNLEFCQWLKAFFDQTCPQPRADYDPAAVRARGKGGKNLEPQFRSRSGGGGGGGAGAGSGRRSVGATSASLANRRAAAPPPSTVKKGSATSKYSSTRSSPAKTHRQQLQQQQKENQRPTSTSASTMASSSSMSGVDDGGSVGRKKGMSSSSSVSSSPNAVDDTAAAAVAASVVADAQLIKKNAELASRCAQLELTLRGIEQERDFYFEKLRGIEVMLQVHDEKGAASDPDLLVRRIFKVLYATSEDNVEVTDEGELVGLGAASDEEIDDDRLVVSGGMCEDVSRVVGGESVFMDESLLEA